MSSSPASHGRKDRRLRSNGLEMSSFHRNRGSALLWLVRGRATSAPSRGAPHRVTGTGPARKASPQRLPAFTRKTSHVLWLCLTIYGERRGLSEGAVLVLRPSSQLEGVSAAQQPEQGLRGKCQNAQRGAAGPDPSPSLPASLPAAAPKGRRSKAIAFLSKRDLSGKQPACARRTGCASPGPREGCICGREVVRS